MKLQYWVRHSCCSSPNVVRPLHPAHNVNATSISEITPYCNGMALGYSSGRHNVEIITKLVELPPHELSLLRLERLFRLPGDQQRIDIELIEASFL